MLPKLPGRVAEVIDRIEQAGGKGYVVGGALRDLLRGQAPHDWDLAATLPQTELLRVFAEAQDIGGVCGTIQLQLSEGSCEITPCRTEGNYNDKRHPAEVAFVPDILADLARRDFTVNAMAYGGRELVDPYGGQADLAAKLLRCVGNPAARFEEDALRILRLYRFMAVLGFAAEAKTQRAAEKAAPTVGALSRERVRGEMGWILASEKPQVLQGLIEHGGLAAYGLKGRHDLAPLAKAPAAALVRWWALAALCSASTDVMAYQFGFSKNDARKLEEVTRLYRLGPSRGLIDLKMKLRHSTIDYTVLASTFAALDEAFAGEEALAEELQRSGQPYRVAHLAVNGGDLAVHSIRGRKCGAVLDELLKLVIQKPEMNRREVLLGLAPQMAQLL